MKILLAGLGLITFTTAASAQAQDTNVLERELQKSGVYMTAAATNQFRQLVAADFVQGAEKAGFTRDQSFKFANSIVIGNIRAVPGGSAGFYVADDGRSNGPASIPANATSLVNYLLSFASAEKVGVYLQKFSTIKIEVQPAPPRDYKIVINGEACPATEKSEYKVMPGESSVNVSRPAIPTCEWKGPIAAGQTQVIPCKL
jgi:hypothetical protein